MGLGGGCGASKPFALLQEKNRELEKELEEAKQREKDADDRTANAKEKAREEFQAKAGELNKQAEARAEELERDAEQHAAKVRKAAEKVRHEADKVVANAKKDAEAEVRAKLKTTNEILERYGLLGELQTDDERTEKGETRRDLERNLQQAIHRGDVVSLSKCLESIAKVKSQDAPSVKDIQLSSHLVRGHNKVLARCFGSEGEDDGQFRAPRQVAIDHETGKMLVVDQKNKRVQEFGRDDKFLRSLFEKRFDSPSGIGLGQKGEIVAVTDAERHTVQIFSTKTGGSLFEVGRGRGPGNNQFDTPGGVAIDSEGQIFVADTNNDRIQVLRLESSQDKRLKFVGFFSGTLGGSCGRLRAPKDVALDRQEKNILVADAGNGRVQVMDKRNGHWVRTIGAGHLKAPQQVATNSVGQIVVVDVATQTVQVYEEDGTWLESLGGQGSAVGQLREPYGVAIDSQDNIVVSDAKQHRVHIFGIAGDKRKGSGEVKETDLYIPRAGGRLRSFGSGGNKEGCGEFQMPRQIAIDKSGLMVVVDQNNKRVQVFDHKKGSFIFEFGKSGTGDGQFQAPSGVSIAPKDARIVVTDVKNHDVQVFERVDDRAEFRLKFGGQGKEPGKFECPSGVAVDWDGNILVADTNNNRIQVFNKDGDFLQQFDRATGASDDEKFKQPRDVLVHWRGHVTVVDSGNERLQVLNGKRELVRNIHSRHLKSPYQVVTDSQRNLVVVDHTNNTVQLYDEEGRWMESLGGSGSAVGQLKEPCGVAVDAENNIVVSTQNRIQIFGPSNRDRGLQGDDNDLWQWEGGSLRCFGVGGSNKGELNTPLQVAIDNSGAFLVWERIGTQKPTGTEVRNEALAEEFVKGKVKFSQKEWEDLMKSCDGVPDLTYDSYIKAGNQYFKPQAAGARMLVVDQKNNRVQVFDEKGSHIDSIGRSGDQNGEFLSPCGVAVDQDGNVYVTDVSQNNVQIFRRDGTFLHKIPQVSKAEHESLKRPMGVAVHDRKIYVADTNNHRIQVFKISEDNHEVIVERNTISSVVFKGPRDVAINRQGNNILVADSGNRQIQVFDTTGKHVRTIGKGYLKAPHQVAIDSRGHIVVVDAGTHTVQIFTEDGTWLESLGGQGSAVGQLRDPNGVAVDLHDNIVVSDTKHNRVQIFGRASNKDAALQIPRTGGPLRCFGSRGAKVGEFQMPRQLAMDTSGHMVVVDQNNKRVQVFDTNGTFIRSFGSKGTQDGQFLAPLGVGVDAKTGRIMVTDVKNHNVQIFDPEGAFLFKIGSGYGDGEGELNNPSGVAMNQDGHILVADSNNNRIAVFDGHDGTFYRFMGSSGELKGPRDVAVGQRGEIVIADTGNGRLQVLDKEENFRHTIYSKHLKTPQQVVIDSANNIVVVDNSLHTVQVYDFEGAWLETLGCQGSAVGQLSGPCGVTVDNEDNVIVSDSQQNRIQIFGIQNYKGTALHVAAARGKEGMCTRLLNHCRELDFFEKKDSRGKTALQVAQQKGHRKVIEELKSLRKQMRKDEEMRPREEELRTEAKKNNTTRCQELLKLNINPSSQDANGDTALHIASAHGHEIIVRHILDSVCKGNEKFDLMSKQNLCGKTPLDLAYFSNHQRVIQELERHTAKMIEQDEQQVEDSRASSRKARESFGDEAKRLEEAREEVERLVRDYTKTETDVLDKEEFRELIQTVLMRDKAAGQGKSNDKFNSKLDDFVSGTYSNAAQGFEDLLQVDTTHFQQEIGKGMEALKQEIKDYANEEVSEIFEYVCYQEASEKEYPNGIRDEGRVGQKFEYFKTHEKAQAAKLDACEVAALRMYTLPAFTHINNPLRDKQRDKPHGLALLCYHLRSALKKLRGLEKESASHHMTFWRGMKNLQVTDEYSKAGGTELAPMSTTSDLRVAIQYSMSARSLIFCIRTINSLERGSDIEWLSAFPAERETLFPPQTFMLPIKSQVVEVDGMHFTIVEVKPQIA